MLISSFFIWWYGDGWKQVFSSIGLRTKAVASSFSVRQLSSTLFAPWKRIISSPGDSLDDKMRAMVDNLFSRAIGFVVRSIVLLSALVCVFVVLILTLIEIVLWPLIPLLVPITIIYGAIL